MGEQPLLINGARQGASNGVGNGASQEHGAADSFSLSIKNCSERGERVSSNGELKWLNAVDISFRYGGERYLKKS
ncbi:hypothetical protein A2U01_0029396 [Trifolium medium]|uniref:Uncharacterized protein n=1 Tax=Trifolium medium TaxID=97028 RepID=A0A392PA55_9FABA|nr:hypothetical protein [Trifolium medium]